MMKHITLLLLGGCFCLFSCTEGKKRSTNEAEEAIIYQIDSVDQKTGVQRMKGWQVDQPIEAGGKQYRLFINRAPSDSLPQVNSEMGTFADNRIVVSITRQDKSKVFGKTFVKSDFASLVPEAYITRSVLEGVVFDNEKTESAAGNIILAASVSFPMTDLYIPFTITITPQGKMSIEKDEDTVDIPLSELIEQQEPDDL